MLVMDHHYRVPVLSCRMREKENQRNLNKKTGLTSIDAVEMESADGMYDGNYKEVII